MMQIDSNFEFLLKLELIQNLSMTLLRVLLLKPLHIFEFMNYEHHLYVAELHKLLLQLLLMQ